LKQASACAKWLCNAFFNRLTWGSLTWRTNSVPSDTKRAKQIDSQLIVLEEGPVEVVCGQPVLCAVSGLAAPIHSGAALHDDDGSECLSRDERNLFANG
jgi:hypothetical protein